jgi:hypothetical protein
MERREVDEKPLCRRNISSSYSGSKSKPNKMPTEGGGKQSATVLLHENKVGFEVLTAVAMNNWVFLVQLAAY